MLNNPQSKYRPFATIDLPDRTWPSRRITAAPRWCSVDLRDGNQSLIDPMDGEKKRRFFNLLLKVGFKEIEVAFPSASQTDFDFVRSLIDENKIPSDVAIQVLTQSRRELIDRTFESLHGVENAIVHLYNATSPLFRRVVFGMEKADVIKLAVEGTSMLREAALKQPDTNWTFQYSPETFTATETDFALEVCERVIEVFEPTPEKPLILNLPATVEMATPNIHADQIEYFCRHVSHRDSVIICLHPHNDRGTAVAATELGIMAGADRVEGCLFNSGERTGNVDLVTLALNLYSQGIDPKLDFSNMHEVVQTVEHCNQIGIHPRHPYAGELVFTAFSGSHQDAIKKGFSAHEKRNDGIWDMPYLPIDPADIGASYEAVIRVNSQSGKGGVAWILEQDKGLKLPRQFQVDFSHVVQEISDETSRELSAHDIWDAFVKTYCLEGPQRFELVDYVERGTRRPGEERVFVGRIAIDGVERPIRGRGNGLISGVIDALASECGLELEVADYHEHALRKGTDSQAAAYVECRRPDGLSIFGIGIDADIATASVKAVLSAANASARKDDKRNTA